MSAALHWYGRPTRTLHAVTARGYYTIERLCKGAYLGAPFTWVLRWHPCASGLYAPSAPGPGARGVSYGWFASEGAAKGYATRLERSRERLTRPSPPER